MVMTARESASVPLPWILRLYVTKNYSREEIADVRRVLASPALPDSWKGYFRERLPGESA
jgi:3-alpha domain